MTPERSYLVCATPRSGSTLVCQALKATRVAGNPEEYFEAVPGTGIPRVPVDYLAGLGVTATLAKHLRKGSGVVRGIDTAPGPHTQLAPQGGLQRHEDAGGHTLAPHKAHVGATDQQILNRLAQGPNLPGVSSYYDRATAERAVSENIAANSTKIQQWLLSGSPKTAQSWRHGSPVGRYAPQGSSSTAGITDVSGSLVVLRRNNSMPDGYHILTSFPQP
jgi:hypothetical protein